MTDAPSIGDVVVVDTATSLAEAVQRLQHSTAIALDVEADGLYAYRPKLCTMQIACQREGVTDVFIVDGLAVTVAPLLHETLGESGPVKVLHDLTFDARLLDEVGVRLARVRDTSVAARLLGDPAIGLSSLVEREFGAKLDKRFQHHNWARRPLLREQIQYLAEDVRYLLALDGLLRARAASLDIEAEIADECDYKLVAALSPSRETRPAYARIKGASALEPIGRAVLRSLVEARDALAMHDDVAPFRIASNELLLDLATQRPETLEALRALKLSRPREAFAHARSWLDAIARGVRAGDIPEEERAAFERPRVDRSLAARRKAADARVTKWRRDEARRRGVDEQAVLPGHCAHDVAGILATASDEAAIRSAIVGIAGIGTKRIERYLDALVALASTAAPAA